MILTMFSVCAMLTSCNGQTDEGSLRFDHISGGYAVSIGTCTDKNVVIPDTYNGEPVISIANNGFSGSDIKSIVIPDSVTQIGSGAFDSCIWITSITIPKNVSIIGTAAFDCYRLQKIEVEEDNEFYKSMDGVLYSKDGKKLVAYPTAKKDEKFEIPDGVTEVNAYAFRENSRIKHVIFSHSVTKIGEYAFYNCSELDYIKMGTGVQIIGACAFAYCDDLNTVQLSSGLKRIEYGAFSHCDSEDFKRLTIPSGTEYIGDSAFTNSFFIERVTIPKTVQYIGKNVFVNTMVQYIAFDGTKSEWKSIRKGASWSGYGDVYVSCSNGEFKY